MKRPSMLSAAILTPASFLICVAAAAGENSRVLSMSPHIRQLLSKQQLGTRPWRLTVLVPECRPGSSNSEVAYRGMLRRFSLHMAAEEFKTIYRGKIGATAPAQN